MKDEYPNYRKTGINFVKNNLSAKDISTLNRFLEYAGTTAGYRKLQIIERHVLQFFDVTGISFDNINLEVLTRFLSLLNKSDKATDTKNEIKKAVKRFLKWKYKNWSKRFDELKIIRTSDGTNHQKLNASTMLTQDELKAMVNASDSFTYKSLILLMYESAGRPEEIVNLKWRDINFQRSEVTLFSSKTRKTRVNPIHESIKHLRRYKEECFYPNAPSESYVFPHQSNKHSHMTVKALYDYFIKLEKGLNFTKHIFPYLLRHTRLTQVHKKLSPKAYEKFAGHSIEIANKRYAHFDNEDVREEMLKKVYQIEELEKQGSNEIAELKDRMRRMETMIFTIIDKANFVFDKVGLAV